jgi:PAS domain-containing protein
VEDRLIDFLPNWALLAALAGLLVWILIKKIEWVFSDLTANYRETLALFADWQRQEWQADKADEVFDRPYHRNRFLLGIEPYSNAYEDKVAISDNVEAQAKLLDGEKLLRALVDHSYNGMIRLQRVSDDGHGNIELRCSFANLAANRFLMPNAEQMAGLTAKELIQFASTGMDSRDSDALFKAFLQTAESGEQINMQIRADAGSGYKWLHFFVEPVGRDIAVTFVDMSERKEKELKLDDEVSKLRKRVREVDEELGKKD